MSSLTEEQFQAIKDEFGYTLAGMLASSRNGFNKAYESAKAEGFPQQQILSNESSARVNAVYDVLAAQYGSIDLKEKGIGGLLAATRAADLLNELIRDLEALDSTSEDEFNTLLDNVRDKFVSQQVSAAGLRI